MPPLLTLREVAYELGKSPILSSINLSLSRGEITGLLGVNGAGKSTTLKIAAGILRPDKGSVILAPPHLAIGYVPEVPPLIPHWSVLKFLRHACSLQHIEKKKQEACITRVQNLCMIEKILSKKCSTLSKGNQQRVAIAQALLHKPDLLILDEPTSGLDPQQIHQFRQLLHQLKKTTGILFSSHIMQEITMLCDRAFIIKDGKQIKELDLANRDNLVLIEFSHLVNNEVFSHLTSWDSGYGKLHRFTASTAAEKNSILFFCLEKKLSIHRVIGIAEAIEYDFLSLIGDPSCVP